MIQSVNHLQKAEQAWGADAPSWVLALAKACMSSSQNQVAQRLGVSASLVSMTIARKYKGDMSRIEALCRAEFERGVIDCPVLGEVAPAICRRWKGKSDRLRVGNNQNARMFRACRACHHNEGGSHEQ